jgi:uncharacterized protein (DUF433 family)
MPLPDPLVTSSPDYLSGTPVFAGTRVPVKGLFDYLAKGKPLDEFLRQFPDVSREHATAVLMMAGRWVVSAAKAA